MSNPKIKKRPYRLVEYDPEWPKQFERYASQIRSILKNDVLEIHHFGSTSIPGMFAKPNIDIYALVSSLEVVRQHKSMFEREGFTSRGDYSNIGEEYFTVDTAHGERIASLHVFEGSPQVFDDYRIFKDYLVTHKNEKERYISLKKELYEKYADDYSSYDAGKKHLIEELKEKAQQWIARA